MSATCVECEKPYLARGLCSAHYSYHKRRNSLPPRIRAGYGEFRPCAAEGCDVVHYARDYCRRHYEAARASGELTEPCIVEGCESGAVAKSMCGSHRARSDRYGLTPLDLAAFDKIKHCEVCGGPAQHIDHDHLTGGVRGVLCRACNTALGMLEDDRARIETLIHYLDRYQASLP